MADCDFCRGRWDLLDSVERQLKSTEDAAPPTVVKAVMDGIRSIRRKEKTGLLPFIVSPAALLIAVLGFLLFNVVQAGPIAMMDETARALAALIKVAQAIGAVVQYIFRLFYLKDAILGLSAVLLGGAAALVFRYFKKSNSGMFGRV
jgi:hypothetical protein